MSLFGVLGKALNPASLFQSGGGEGQNPLQALMQMLKKALQPQEEEGAQDTGQDAQGQDQSSLNPRNLMKDLAKQLLPNPSNF